MEYMNHSSFHKICDTQFHTFPVQILSLLCQWACRSIVKLNMKSLYLIGHLKEGKTPCFFSYILLWNLLILIKLTI